MTNDGGGGAGGGGARREGVFLSWSDWKLWAGVVLSWIGLAGFADNLVEWKEWFEAGWMTHWRAIKATVVDAAYRWTGLRIASGWIDYATIGVVVTRAFLFANDGGARQTATAADEASSATPAESPAAGASGAETVRAEAVRAETSGAETSGAETSGAETSAAGTTASEQPEGATAAGVAATGVAASGAPAGQWRYRLLAGAVLVASVLIWPFLMFVLLGAMVDRWRKRRRGTYDSQFETGHRWGVGVLKLIAASLAGLMALLFVASDVLYTFGLAPAPD